MIYFIAPGNPLSQKH